MSQDGQELSESQKEVAFLAAQILSGVLAGSLAKPNQDLGSVRPFHIQGAVNLALAIREEVKTRMPG